MKSRAAIHTAVVITTFLIAVFGNSLLIKFVDVQTDNLWLKTAYSYAWWVLPVIVATGLLFGFQRVIHELGLNKSFIKGIVIAFLFTLPMLAGSAITGELNTSLNPLNLLRSTLFAGFFEELLFRGFLFGILFRRAGWGFIPASLPGALVFGMLHLYQGSNPTELTGIFLVTFVGSLWFAWLYTEWDLNLWVPIGLHIFMNLSWALFFTGFNALGGWEQNVFRIATIASSVVFTIMMCRNRKLFIINGKNLFWVRNRR